MNTDMILATLPGETDSDRIVVLLRAAGGLELQRQSFGVGLGWFTQSSVPLNPDQVAELRGLLGSRSGHVRSASPAASHLRLHAESA